MQEYDEPLSPRDLVAQSPLPLDARRMGFDRNTEEGAMIALAASLNPAKTTHRVVAWLLLLAFAAPALLGIAHELF